MKKLQIFVSALALLSCTSENQPLSPSEPPVQQNFNLENVARMLSALPIGRDQMEEVYGAVNSSSSEGYDEEYTMNRLMEDPGSGTGGSKAVVPGGVPLRQLIADYLSANASKAGAADVEALLKELSESDMQIYWPFSEAWDGEQMPLITFDPGYGIETNYAYEISYTPDGVRVVDSVFVDEAVAMKRPVWVVNNNSDAAYTPLSPIEIPKGSMTADSGAKSLYIKSLKALRNYDCWFAGASEFFIKCGSVTGMKSMTDTDLRNFYPQLNDMVVVVRRKEVGEEKLLDGILVSSFPDQSDKLAFLMTEDDGGQVTNWKCAATVKVNSKSYGFDLSIPYGSRDDIVWRGQLDSDYFRKSGPVKGRFGDVEITFELK